MRSVIESICATLGLGTTATLAATTLAFMLLYLTPIRGSRWRFAAILLPALAAALLLWWETRNSFFCIRLLEQGNALSDAQKAVLQSVYIRNVIKVTLTGVICVSGLWLSCRARRKLTGDQPWNDDGPRPRTGD